MKKKSIQFFKHFYSQIEAIPSLLTRATVIDQALMNNFNEIKNNANSLLQHLHEEREEFLQEFNGWLLPAAKEVIDGLYSDAEKLKKDLDGEPQLSKEIWTHHAQKWNQLYENFQDKNSLVQKVISVAYDRVKDSINEDIRFIQDYQTHSLSPLSDQPQEVIDLEKRLLHAIKDPLKDLAELQNIHPTSTSITQTADRIASVHEKRMKYSDTILMKIDAVVKKEIVFEEHHDVETHAELEQEISFMEQELKQIENEVVRRKDIDTQGVKSHLESLKEHIQDLCSHRIPKFFQEKLDLFVLRIDRALVQLK